MGLNLKAMLYFGSTTRSLERPGIVLALAITLVGLAARLNGLVTPARDMWIDESFSVWLASQPPLEAIRTIAAIDQHPPLYALLLHVWLLPGESPWWTRLFSVLLGTAAIPVAYRLGRVSAGVGCGCLAATFVALSPILVRYAQEARMYALVVLLVSLATFFLIEAIEHGRPRAWVGYGIATLLLVYTHNIALFLLPGQSLYVLWRARECRNLLRPYLTTMAIVGLLWLAWLPTLLLQSSGVIQRFWIGPPTAVQVSATELDLFDAFIPGRTTLVGLIIPRFNVLVALAAATFVGLAGRGVVGRGRHNLLFLGSFALPVGIDLLLSQWRPIFEERVLLYTAVGAIVLVAMGLATIRDARIRTVLILFVVGLNLASLANYDATFSKERWRDVASLVAARAQPGDLILFNATWSQLPFDYYYGRLTGPRLVEHGLPVDLFDRGVLEPPMTIQDLPTISRLTAGRSDVWVLLSHDWYNDPQHLIPPATRALFSSDETWTLGDIVIRRYHRSL